MKTNRLFLGLAAVPLLLGGLGLTLPSHAATRPATLVAQTATQRQERHAAFDKALGLSATQKAQLQAIRAATAQQMAAVFTPAQKAQLQAARQQHQRPNLNLSDAQKAQIKAIQQQAQRQREGVLTAQQRQQWQTLHQQHQHRSASQS